MDLMKLVDSYTRRPKRRTANRLSDLEFDEVSLVTRPANQHAKIVLYKSADKSKAKTAKQQLNESKARTARTNQPRSRPRRKEPVSKSVSLDDLHDQLQSLDERIIKGHTILRSSKLDDLNERINDKATEIRKFYDPTRSMTQEQAISRVLRENPDLNAEYEAMHSQGAVKAQLSKAARDNSMRKVEAKARKLMQQDESLTMEAAIALVIQQNPELYKQYRSHV